MHFYPLTPESNSLTHFLSGTQFQLNTMMSLPIGKDMEIRNLLHYQALVIWFCLCLVQSVHAREDLVPGSRYTSARAAAMGDAALPLGDDVASGLFYNPADLGKLRKAEIEPLNFAGYVNSPFISTAGSNFYQATSLSSYSPTLQKSPGQLAGLGGQLLPNFGLPGFGFGILGLSQLAAQANSNGTVTYKSLYQIIPAIGVGYRLLDGVIRVGYSLQWVNEATGSRTVSVNSSIGYDQNLNQGSGFSNNFGIAVTAPIRSLPSLNFVVRNALNTSYNGSSMMFPLSNNSPGPPLPDLMSFDGSFSIQPRLGRGMVLNLVLEDRDITNTSGMAFMGHFAAGMEVNFQNKFFLRGGWGSGYPCAGIGLKRPGADISLTYYTEEIGTSYLSKGDTRYVIQYQIRVF